MRKHFLLIAAFLLLGTELHAQQRTLLKQSTAVTVNSCPFLDVTDVNMEMEGLTLSQADTRISKNHAAYAQKNDATSASHKENGIYGIVFNSTDTGTAGPLDVYINEAGAIPCEMHFLVVPANVYDSLVSGTDKLETDIQQFGGSNGTFSGGIPAVNTTQFGGTNGTFTSGRPTIQAINGITFPTNFNALAIDSSGRMQIQYGTSTGQIQCSAGICSVNFTQANGTNITATGGRPEVIIPDNGLTAAKFASDVTTEFQTGAITLKSGVSVTNFPIQFRDANNLGVENLNPTTQISCKVHTDNNAWDDLDDTSETELGRGTYLVNITNVELTGTFFEMECLDSTGQAFPFVYQTTLQH